MKLNFKIMAVCAVSISLAAMTGPVTRNVESQEGFVGTKSCGMCHPDEKKAYEAHRHAAVTTAGWVENGQDAGIGCEACHGPGQEHIAIGPSDLKKVAEEEGDLKILGKADNKKSEFCMKCHQKNDDTSVDMTSDFVIANMQQYSELQYSKKAKFNMTCTMCHDPHITSEGQEGIRKNRKCLDCHKGKFAVEIKIKAMADLSCEDCHMPFAVSRGQAEEINGYFKGDVRSHVFGITPDADYVLNNGGKATVNDEELIRLTVETTCYACHRTGEASDYSREKLLSAAGKIH